MVVRFGTPFTLASVHTHAHTTGDTKPLQSQASRRALCAAVADKVVASQLQRGVVMATHLMATVLLAYPTGLPSTRVTTLVLWLCSEVRSRSWVVGMWECFDLCTHCSSLPYRCPSRLLLQIVVLFRCKREAAQWWE